MVPVEERGVAGRVLNLRACAKINLVLDLLGPRPDGFTEIATIFQSIDLADRVGLTFRPGAPADIRLEETGDPVCPAEENLALRAARLFQDELGLRGGLSIRLEKKIPAGAGLGGGSADAAAVLWGLWVLSGGDPEEVAPLASLGARLGSDVPFFFDPGLSLGRGRGEILTPLADLPAWPVVIVRPPASLSTREVYGRARAGLTARESPPNILRFLQYLEGAPAGFPPLANDLFPAASGLLPAIAGAVSRLEELGGRAGMTGSGSAVFGLFAAREQADAAAEQIGKERPLYWVTTTRALPRPEARKTRME